MSLYTATLPHLDQEMSTKGKEQALKSEIANVIYGSVVNDRIMIVG